MIKKIIINFLSEKSYLGFNFGIRKKIFLSLIDLIILNFSFFISFLFEYQNINFISLLYYKIIILFLIIDFSVKFYFKLYDYPTKEQDYDKYLQIIFFITIIFFSFLYILDLIHFLNVSNALVIILIYYFTSLFIRLFLTQLVTIAKKNKNAKLIAIIGVNEDAKILQNIISRNKDVDVSCFYCDDNLKDNEQRQKYISKVPIFYNLHRFYKFINKNKISKIYYVDEISENSKNLINSYAQEKGIEIEKAINIHTNLSDYIFNTNINSFYSEILSSQRYRQNINFQNEIYKGKNICITGAAGTIGSAIFNHLAKTKVNKLFAIDNSEIGIFNLKKNFSNDKRLSYHLGSLNDISFITNFFLKNKIDYIFHAAAYKHVSLVEDNKISGIINNVFATEILLSLVSKFNVKNFILISSDKAVEPSNLMGKTKRICEILCQKYSKKASENQKYLTVRFGNIAGSSGSVIPIFLENVKANKDIVVKDTKTNRYFMSSSEAAYLVTMSSGIESNNGDIFYLNMGESYNILNLAKKILKMFPHSKSKIIISSLDNNEKIEEKLLYDFETKIKTNESKIFIVRNNNTQLFNDFDKRYKDLTNFVKSMEAGEVIVDEDLINFKVDQCLS